MIGKLGLHEERAGPHLGLIHFKNRNSYAYFDNPNTPSSSKHPGDKGEKNKKGKPKKASKRKQGAQPGHKGTTNKPKPTILAVHAPDKCHKCGDSGLKMKKTETRNITNTHVTVVTTKHDFYRGYCEGCGACTEPPERPTALERMEQDADARCAVEAAAPETNAAPDSAGDVPAGSGGARDSAPAKVQEGIPESVAQCASQRLPKRGEYGLGVVTATVMRHMDRLPFKLNSRAWARHNVAMSAGTVYAILASTGAGLAAPAEDILRRIRAAYVLNVDETSFSYNGETVWVWIFYNPETGDAYIVIRPSRGSDVVKEVLGEEWPGWLVCDGWTAYNGYRKQRCWSHITTAIRHVAKRNEECAEAQRVRDTLRKIYRTACNVKGPMRERRRMRALLDRRVHRIVAKYKDVPELKSFITTLSRARPDLFHFVTDPRLPSTNNAAERGLREIVVHRKVRGSIRAEATMTWMGNLFSCVSTWRERGMDVQEELVKYI